MDQLPRTSPQHCCSASRAASGCRTRQHRSAGAGRKPGGVQRKHRCSTRLPRRAEMDCTPGNGQSASTLPTRPMPRRKRNTSRSAGYDPSLPSGSFTFCSARTSSASARPWTGSPNCARWSLTSSPSRAAELRGIAAETITRVSRELATTERAAVHGRLGTTLNRRGTLTCWALQEVNSLRGHLDLPAACYSPNQREGDQTSSPDATTL